MPREFELNVDSNAAEVADLFAALADKMVPQAEATAINKTLSQERTEVRKDVKSQTGVPVKILRKRVHIKRATKRKRVGRLWFGTYNVLVKDLSPRQTKRGVSHSGAGGRRRIDSAFIATMKSGHTGVFKRAGKARLKIHEQAVKITPAARRAMQQARVRMPGRYRRLASHEVSFRTQREINKRRLQG